MRRVVMLMCMTLGAACFAQEQKPMPKDAKPGFEVATIKPSDPAADGGDIDMVGRRFVLHNYSVKNMIAFAYGMHRDQVLNGPSWLSDRYDVNGIPDVEGDPTVKQMQIMVQKLLTDRFGLKFHREQKELPMYAITVAKGGVKMGLSKAPEEEGPNIGVDGGAHRRVVTCSNITMDEFALALQSFFMEKPVQDRTELKERYDFKVTWNPDLGGDGEASDVPSLYTAFPEQLGLKIEAKKGMVGVLVVDGMTRPSEN